jgi:hypothetical protein
VNQQGSNVGVTVVSYTGKLVLTLLVSVVFLAAFGLVSHVHHLLVSQQESFKNMPPIYVGKPVPNGGNPSVHPFWPEFPHTDPGYFQTLVVNGIRVMTEEWDCENSPGEILSYYRDQMTARGWQDITEQAYNLQPNSQSTAVNLQSEKYIAVYRQIMDSTLVFSHDGWSLRVSTAPSQKNIGKMTVKFFAAMTPYTGSSFPQTPFDLGNKQSDKPLDILQDSATEHYHTTIATKNEPVDTAFQEKFAELSSQGWQTVISLPKKQTPFGYFIWLVRGKQYAALSVAAMPQGQGTTVTFTEVTPNN